VEDSNLHNILNFGFVQKTNELRVLIDFDKFDIPELEKKFNVATQVSQLRFLREFIIFIDGLPKNEDLVLPGLGKLNIENLYFSFTREENQIRMWHGEHGWQVDSRHVDSGKTRPILNLTLRGDCNRKNNPYIQLIESLGYSLTSQLGYYKYTKEG
jgi:hypothetical protein